MVWKPPNQMRSIPSTTARSFTASRGIRFTYIFRSTPFCILLTTAFMFVTGDTFGRLTFAALVAFFCVVCILNIRRIRKISFVIDDQKRVLFVHNYFGYREIEFDSIDGYRVISSMMGNRIQGPKQDTAGLPIIFYGLNRRVDVTAALFTPDNLSAVNALMDLMKQLKVDLM